MKHQTKRSQTWMIFEKHMMWRKQTQGNFIFPDMSRGAAINLCQGLNAAQTFWQHEMGLPDSQIFFSAKAKKREDGSWYVEISEAHAKQGIRKRESALLAQLANLPASVDPLIEVLPNAPVHSSLAADDPRAVNPNEDIFERMLK